jgi:hypothetical protein
LVERLTVNQVVVGSSPTRRARKKMEKLTKPVRPKSVKIPEILKGNKSKPERFIKKIIYETPTLAQIFFDKLKKKKYTDRMIMEKFEKMGWKIELENGELNLNNMEVIKYEDYSENNPENFDLTPKNLKDIFNNLKVKDYDKIKIQVVPHNEYSSGISVYLEEEDLQYEEKLKAWEEYNKKCEKFWEDCKEFICNKRKYNEYRESKIKEKIKEMEELGDI